MANSFGTDILIQAADPKRAALFYVKQLGFEITGETPNMISVHGDQLSIVCVASFASCADESDCK